MPFLETTDNIGSGQANLGTVGPLIIESLWAEKRESTRALGALDDPLVVQTKI